MKKRLDKNDIPYKEYTPVNKLDESALEHDICYRDNKDIESRNKCDEKLEYQAWNRVLDNNAALSEKIPAWITTNVMKTKRHLGMGLRF